MRRRNVIAADLRSPKYRKRVVRDRTKYTRKAKHKLASQPRPPRQGCSFSGLRRAQISGMLKAL